MSADCCTVILCGRKNAGNGASWVHGALFDDRRQTENTRKQSAVFGRMFRTFRNCARQGDTMDRKKTGSTAGKKTAGKRTTVGNAAKRTAAKKRVSTSKTVKRSTTGISVSNKRTSGKKGKPSRTVSISLFGVFLLLVLTLVLLIKSCVDRSNEYRENTDVDVEATKPEIDVQLLDVNEYSRPALESNRITGIVIHYTANPGATAQNNRDYFQSLKDTHETRVSSHFVVGLEGEIIQCIPTWEIAYASNERNADTVSIECCHPDESGEFTDATYRSVVQLTAWLCRKFELDEQDVIRHYDVTGKICPKYFVDHEDAWTQFREDVKHALEKE